MKTISYGRNFVSIYFINRYYSLDTGISTAYLLLVTLVKEQHR